MSSLTITSTKTCLICYRDNLHEHRAIVPCGHNDVCATCHLRLRFLLNDKKCPICKTLNDRIIVDADEISGDSMAHKEYSQYEAWGDDLGSNFTYRSNVQMFFHIEYHDENVEPLFSLKCQERNCHFLNNADSYVNQNENRQQMTDPKKKKPPDNIKRISGMKALNEHLRSQHGMTLCHLCVEAKRDFISCLPRFRPEQLKRHQAKGDGDDSGFRGHPQCEFCRPKRFYDLSKLHEHLNMDHYKCHVCEKQGLHNQFFKNYYTLARHFERVHFLCGDPQCLAARFVVFDNEIDLRAHEIEVHGHRGASGDTKIQLQFQIRGATQERSNRQQTVPNDGDFNFGLGGDVFVPEELPNTGRNSVDDSGGTTRQENEPQITDAAHAARTANLREEAQRIRQAQDVADSPDAFPSLGGGDSEQQDEQNNGASSSRGNLVGWTGTVASKASAMTKEEHFPVLGGRAKKSNANKMMVKPHNSSSLSAISSAGGPSWSGSGSTSASSAAPSFQSDLTSSAAYGTRQSFGPIITRTKKVVPLTTDNFPSLGPPSSKVNNSLRYGRKKVTAVASAASVNRIINGSASGAVKAAAAIDNEDYVEYLPEESFETFAAAKKIPSAASYKPKAVNKTENLAVDNFPSLGGGGSGKQPATKQPRKKAQAPPKKKTTQYASAGKLALELAVQNAQASGAIPDKSREQISDIKSVLGSVNYKQLKRLTKEFALDSITPEAYVDQAASLFENGTKDVHFSSFMPQLISSCPNTNTSARAIQYLEGYVEYLPEESFETFAAAKKIPSAASYKPKAVNKTENLAVDNFPSFGGSGSGKQSASTQPTKKTQAPPKKKTMQYAAADKLALELAVQNAQASGAITDESREQISDIKSVIGSVNYKQLKRLTKEFALDSITPEAYVDQAASLFENGTKDVHFSSFMPQLISSCPNMDTSARAIQYLENLQFALALNGGSNGSTSKQSALDNGQNSGAGWAAMASTTSPPPPTQQFAAAPPPGYKAVKDWKAPPTAVRTIAAKKPGWGGATGNSAIRLSNNGARPKQLQPKKYASKVVINNRIVAGALSVTAAAAEEEDSKNKVGSATIAMAKMKSDERKMKQLESQQKQGGSGLGKSKKKKKKDDLRNLAFGGN